MLKFFNKDNVIESIENEIRYKKSHTTKRNGNSISLRPIIYNCIREVYYEIFDYDRMVSDDLTFDKSFYWTGPLGSTLHDMIQRLTGLDKMPYTEKLITFNSFAPLKVRTKCDGIDTSDPENMILYEFKTKDKMPDKPYHEELLQNLLSVFFFRSEYRLKIKGCAMVYINRQDPYDMRFHNYDLFDITSPLYLDVKKELKPIFEKVNELLRAMTFRRPPSMDSKYIKKFAYGRCRCIDCVYREHCKNDGGWTRDDLSKKEPSEEL